MTTMPPGSERGPRGVYLLTPDWDDTGRLLATVAAALRAGVGCVQYRHKTADAALRLAQARALRALTREAGCPLIVNDDPALALAVQADGVHVGRDDSDPAAARAALPPAMWLGVSCYADGAAAQRAVESGADYVAFGSVFASPTKPAAVRAPLPLLRDARAAGLHCVAIGGIDAGNIAEVAAGGARAAALISAVFAAADAGAAARLLVSEFERGRVLYESQRAVV